MNDEKTNKIMDFRTELAKWGYNRGNSIDVETLINEILPSLSSKQNKKLYSEEEVHAIIESYQNNVENNPNHITYDKWFEKLKKK